MASMPKPPRDVRIKQAKYGTGSGSMASTARAAQAMREAAQNRSHHTSGRHSIAKGRCSLEYISHLVTIRSQSKQSCLWAVVLR